MSDLNITKIPVITRIPGELFNKIRIAIIPQEMYPDGGQPLAPNPDLSGSGAYLAARVCVHT